MKHQTRMLPFFYLLQYHDSEWSTLTLIWIYRLKFEFPKSDHGMIKRTPDVLAVSLQHILTTSRSILISFYYWVFKRYFSGNVLCNWIWTNPAQLQCTVLRWKVFRYTCSNNCYTVKSLKSYTLLQILFADLM